MPHGSQVNPPADPSRYLALGNLVGAYVTRPPHVGVFVVRGCHGDADGMLTLTLSRPGSDVTEEVPASECHYFGRPRLAHPLLAPTPHPVRSHPLLGPD